MRVGLWSTSNVPSFGKAVLFALRVGLPFASTLQVDEVRGLFSAAVCLAPLESTQKSPTAVCWSASKNASALPKVSKLVLLATNPLSYRQFIETHGKFGFGWYCKCVVC